MVLFFFSDFSCFYTLCYSSGGHFSFKVWHLHLLGNYHMGHSTPFIGPPSYLMYSPYLHLSTASFPFAQRSHSHRPNSTPSAPNYYTFKSRYLPLPPAPSRLPQRLSDLLACFTLILENLGIVQVSYLEFFLP